MSYEKQLYRYIPAILYQSLWDDGTHVFLSCSVLTKVVYLMRKTYNILYNKNQNIV